MAAVEVFWRFLLLGCTSFGGPVAHLGYFRTLFVTRLQWLDEAAYARLVALGQFLPGPGSSQVGFAIGLERAGLAGGIAAFLGFTLPSFLLLAALGAAGSVSAAPDWATGLVSGLKMLAVVVVLDAVRGMYRSFCTEAFTASLCVASACVMLAFSAAGLQPGVLLLAAGLAVVRARLRPPASVPDATAVTHSDSSLDPGEDSARPAPAGVVTVHWWPLLLLAALLMLVFALAPAGAMAMLARDFAGAGALVFGGGHVVLPLLESSVGAAVGPETFLTGYAAAQAVPGPMFTLAAYLGAQLAPHAPWLGAATATLAIFLPGLLLVLALRDAFTALAERPYLAAAVGGINAAVVGLLLAALYQPVFVAAVGDGIDLALVVAGAFLLINFRPPILMLVAGFAGIGVLRALL